MASEDTDRSNDEINDLGGEPYTFKRSPFNSNSLRLPLSPVLTSGAQVRIFSGEPNFDSQS